MSRVLSWDPGCGNVVERGVCAMPEPDVLLLQLVSHGQMPARQWRKKSGWDGVASPLAENATYLELSRGLTSKPGKRVEAAAE